MDDLTPPHWGAPDQHVIEPCPNPWCHSHKTTDAEIRSFEAPIVEPSRSSFEKRVSCPCCPMSGPWANTETEAIAAWNHRPLVQQAIAAERGEPVAWMYKSVFGTEICRFRWGADEGLTSDHWVGWAETPLYTLRTQIFGEASDGE